MKLHARFGVFMIALVGIFSRLGAAPTISVPSGIDPQPWDTLLQKYVNEQGLVAYEKWKANAGDLKTLDEFVSRYTATTDRHATGPEEIAALVNVYNAFTIRWILQNYPTDSIRKLDDSWGTARWKVGGKTISLDEIEHKNLRPLYGWKVHATIVCAARSCPPLQRQAYTAENLGALTAQAYRAWLGRDDLNQFDPGVKRVMASPIFKWFKGDFSGDGDLAKVFGHYAPEKYRAFLESGDFKVDYLDYNWGLNDQTGRGTNFRAGLFDRVFGNAK